MPRSRHITGAGSLHGQSPGWQAILPFSGRLPTTVLSSAACLMEIRAQAERDTGIDLKLFGFIPESCSRSPRNGVRNHPGIAFTFPRIPQVATGLALASSLSAAVMITTEN